ncbi:peptidoglycan-binding domain-containing protein [Dyella sp.]|uniref:peptidoglycan-binding domain-containing protein n=1 Tax=Dyella sp. TaxID=1869338 RepID=UPI002B4787FF|nr:peptidoglycan-binding domain-containing protein [Dyella sp.]HKT30614.1 peptidoglycan-binding domain-containing protein [Dyella sp.]
MEDKHKRDGWYLGMTSQRHESGGHGPGAISTGQGDHGGISYGTYQFSTLMGTLREYLDQSAYKDQFKDLEPTTPAFDAKWRDLARTDPGFAEDQHDFIKRSHYDVQAMKLKAAGLDLSDRGAAVQDALWSTSVQYRNVTQDIFRQGLIEKFGKDYSLASLSDKDIVEAVQDYKIAHNERLFKSSPRRWHDLLKRALSEKADLLALADHGISMEPRLATSSPDMHPERASSQIPRGGILKQGDHSEHVRTLQSHLALLGYTDARGNALQADARFGPATRAAVETFQCDQHLDVDGIAGPQTMRRLHTLVHERSLAQATTHERPANPAQAAPALGNWLHGQNREQRTPSVIAPPFREDLPAPATPAPSYRSSLIDRALGGLEAGDNQAYFRALHEATQLPEVRALNTAAMAMVDQQERCTAQLQQQQQELERVAAQQMEHRGPVMSR